MATVRFLGHASFLITTQAGVRLLTDPYGPGAFQGQLAYLPISDRADVVLITHEHPDHNYVRGLVGRPVVLRETGEAHGLRFRAVPSLHGRPGGQDRGGNQVFAWEADGVRFCHLGDLGFSLTEEQVAELGPVDVAFTPVGGTFTVDAAGARQVARQIGARVLIPMHFQVPGSDFPLRPVDDLLGGPEPVVKVGGSEWEVEQGSLPASLTIVVMEPANALVS